LAVIPLSVKSTADPEALLTKLHPPIYEPTSSLDPTPVRIVG
jgi:hypothetical protein